MIRSNRSPPPIIALPSSSVRARTTFVPSTCPSTSSRACAKAEWSSTIITRSIATPPRHPLRNEPSEPNPNGEWVERTNEPGLERFSCATPSVVVSRSMGGDSAVFERGFEDPAAVEPVDRGAVDLLPGRLALGELGNTFLPLATFYLLL